MKSIANQYRDLKEGRMSQANFMRNLRMTLPQYITNTTSYDSAIKILRNKSILSESIIKQLEKGIKVEKEHTKDEIKAAKIALDHLKEDPKYYTKLTKAGLEESHEGNTQWVEALVDILDEKGINIPEGFQLEDYDGMTPQQAADKIESELMNNDDIDAYANASDENDDSYPTDYDNIDDYNDGEFWEAKDGDDDAETLAMINKIAAEKAGEEEVMAQYDESLNEAKSWTNTSGKEMYAQFKEIDNLNGQEILIGIDFEMENNHELSKAEAAKIVARKLKQNPNFYTAHALAGKEMKEIPTIGKLIPGSDQMKPLKTEADLVDKDNGLKPVKGVEKVKASANKATKETNKPVAGISLMSLIAKTSKGVTKMVATGEKMKVVKESKKSLSEVRANDRQLNTVAQQVKSYIESNPTLKQESDLFAVQNWDDKALLRYDYWDRMPSELFQKLALQFNIELDSEQDEDTGENIFYILTPKFKVSDQTGVARFLTKEGLLDLVREVLAEMESDDEVNTDVDLGLGETMDGRDNLTDTAGHQFDEGMISGALAKVKDKIVNSSLFKKLIDTIVSKMSDKDIATFKAKFNIAEAEGGPSLDDIMSKVNTVNPDKMAKTPEDLKEVLDEDTLEGKIAGLVRSVAGINLLLLGGAPLGVFINSLLGISTWGFGAFIGPVISLVASLIIHGISSRLLGKTDDDSVV